MNLEEAIRSAVVYEKTIRDIYTDAAEKSADPDGRKIFSTLAEEEEKHIAYLEHKLLQWLNDGKITLETLESVIPSKESIEKGLANIRPRMARDDRSNEKQMLSKALKVEVETSQFYRKMADEMTDDGKRMFARFLEIEEGHVAAVQAELDHLSQTGYWLDFKEFDME